MIKLRIPCKESFAFIEEDYEGDDVKGRYDELYALMNPGEQKVGYRQFILDLTDIVKHNMVMEGEGAIEYHESLDQIQKELAKQIKLYGNRLISKYKPEK